MQAGDASMEYLVERYRYCMEHESDPRTKNWLLMSSPWPTVSFVALYLLSVYYGQRIMAHRAPFNLKGLMVAYNLFLVLLSIYMVSELLMSSWFAKNFNMYCALVDVSDNAASLRFASVIWWYYFSKLIEFADTIIFVLRKKNNQVSYLHLYHHFSMPLLWWVGTRFAPGGEAFFCATLNSCVHVVMYSYYLLSALGPRVQPYLWWKKYLTCMQLGQFVVILMRVTYTVFTGCQYPRLFQKMLMVYMLSLIVFFSNFFIKTYQKGVRVNDDAETKEKTVKNGYLAEGHVSNSTKEGKQE